MRVVIDTNIFISSFFYPNGNPKRVIDLWKNGKITICITEEILKEYVKVLAGLGFSNEPELEELLGLFKKKNNIIYIASTPKFNLIKDDPDDDKFIECTVAARAQYIISGDKHLLNLKTFQNITVISPSEFLNI
ncbi:MAG: putative toxin-antitoxin system toxin component, PIN family [Actinobacteria bacterium]|nr:putative toxin-antitoxin system toxin component, PIN family [Actinomycetota bacterium]